MKNEQKGLMMNFENETDLFAAAKAVVVKSLGIYGRLSMDDVALLNQTSDFRGMTCVIRGGFQRVVAAVSEVAFEVARIVATGTTFATSCSRAGRSISFSSCSSRSPRGRRRCVVNARPSTTQVWTDDYLSLARWMTRDDAVAFARPLSLEFQQAIAQSVAARGYGPTADVLREIQTIPAGATFTDIDVAAQAAAKDARLRMAKRTPRRGRTP